MKPVVIFDIEASCEDREINPRYNMETIEIGAVKLLNSKVIDEFQIFIEPEYIQDLTPFCKELTGITFEDLRGQLTFLEGIVKFYDFIENCDIYSCGDFDRKFLINEIKEKDKNKEYELVSNRINAYHTDLKKIYTKITSNKKAGMVGMANKLNIELTGKHHRGIDDARNLAKIYIALDKIRETNLVKCITDIDKLIESINSHHLDNYEITRKQDKYICTDRIGNLTTEYNLVSLLDAFSEVIAIDIRSRKLNYISEAQLKCLERFTI